MKLAMSLTPFSFLLLILLPILTSGFSIHKLSLTEATIDELQLAFRLKKLTSRQLLRGVIEVNPDALFLGEKADHERRIKAPISFSKLHGIPILVKDNIASKDKLNTTAGSFALLGSVVPRDAGVVAKLRKAGAIILGKASLSEWSYSRSNLAPPGWNGRAGQGVNPYNTLQTPCGSSSGSGISAAANLAAVTLGTETDGSILCPSSLNSVVGIKPTVGLTSRAGVVPITPRQDSVGPICRTVSDAAYVLDVIAGIDKYDSDTTAASKYIPKGGYAQFLRRNGLKGKRIGIVRFPFFEFGNFTSAAKTSRQHLNTLRKEGAVLIDNLEISNINEISSGLSEHIASTAEFKIALNKYLSELVTSPVRSLADVIDFNNKHPKLKTKGFGNAEKAALAKLATLTEKGFVKLMTKYKLDALVALGGANFPFPDVQQILAIGGFPGITIPAGYIAGTGFINYDGLPFGIIFGGLRGSEPKLIEIAYAFEQATKVRKPPTLFK
ncbi:hypothetical protein UlMin_030893 [Ulmus minor]